jgi:hypothetical protein
MLWETWVVFEQQSKVLRTVLWDHSESTVDKWDKMEEGRTEAHEEAIAIVRVRAMTSCTREVGKTAEDRVWRFGQINVFYSCLSVETKGQEKSQEIPSFPVRVSGNLSDLLNRNRKEKEGPLMKRW